MKVRGPLDGWPKTKLLRDRKGNATGLRITASYHTPEAHRRIMAMSGLVTAIAALDIGFLALKVESLDFFIAATVGVVLLFGVSRWFWGWVFQKTTIIEMDPQVIRIGGLFFFTNYSLAMPAQFNMEPHEQGWLEARDMEVNRQRRSRLYLDSFHVVMALPGQKVEIATVYKKRLAEAFVSRLQLAQQLWDAADAGEQTGGAPEGPRGPRPDPA